MKHVVPLVLGCLLLARSAGAQVLPRGPLYSGSGTVNPGSIRTVDPSGTNYGNLYVTGQVTGGTSFRGNVPYTGANELRVPLPGAGVDNFNRDSFGLDRYRSGTNYYVPQPFYRPSTTAYSAADALAGRLTPSPAMPTTPAPGLPWDLMDMTRYRSLRQPEQVFASPADPSLAAVPPVPGASLVVPRLTELPQRAGALDLSGEYEARPGMSMLFGLVGPRELGRLQEAPTDQEPTGPIEPTEDYADTDDDPDGQTARRGERYMPKLHSTAPAEPPAEKDVYADVLRQLTERRSGPFRLPRSGGPTPEPPRPSRDDLEGLDVDPAQRRSLRRPETNMVIRADRVVVLDHLGGQDDDPFNRQMRMGDRELRAGQFYRSAAHYESAAMYRRTNPLAPIGACLAYLGAGESYRAGALLRRAVRLSPAMARVRLNVDEMLGKHVVDRRLEEMKARLADRQPDEDVPLAFLVTFLHASRNDLSETTEWAARLAAAPGQDLAVLMYARQLLPPELAEQIADSQPASLPDDDDEPTDEPTDEAAP